MNEQKKYMNKNYPNYRIIEDIGSSINLNRKGLQEIIDLLLNNKLDTLVIKNKSTLSSIGYDLLSNLFDKYNCKIILQTNGLYNRDDIIYDVEEIINFYKKINKNVSVKKDY